MMWPTRRPSRFGIGSHRFTILQNLPVQGALAMSSCFASPAYITLFDGCGTALEQWCLNDSWPQAVNFGELDYSQSEECTIDITLRYSQVEYQSCCPAATPGVGLCSGCGSKTPCSTSGTPGSATA